LLKCPYRYHEKPPGSICVYAHDGFAAPRMLGDVIHTAEVEGRKYPPTVQRSQGKKKKKKKSSNIENV
jgi:hypothetical protein